MHMRFAFKVTESGHDIKWYIVLMKVVVLIGGTEPLVDTFAASTAIAATTQFVFRSTR